MKTPGEKFHDWLEPNQELVTIVLLLCAGIAIYTALFQRDAVVRTAVALWLLLP